MARPATSGRRLVRLKVAARAPEVPLAGVPHGSHSPSVSHFRAGHTYRLAVVSGQQDIGLRLVDLRAPRQGDTITSHSPFCDATRMDTPGRFSPDGRQVAFTSDRSGNQQVWVANVDGSAPRSVTELQDATVSLGSWSPDGRRLAFDATMGNKTHIYVVPVGGGPPTRVTNGTATEIDPEWSRDGRWIYYASDESGQSAIWKVTASGGARTRLSSELGFDPRESPDGRSIYFIDRPRNFGLGPVATLKRVSVDGGPAERVDVPVMPGAWDVTDAGIVFVFVPGLGGATDFARAPMCCSFTISPVDAFAPLERWPSVSGLTGRPASSRYRAMAAGQWPAMSTAGSATSSSSTGSGKQNRHSVSPFEFSTTKTFGNLPVFTCKAL